MELSMFSLFVRIQLFPGKKSLFVPPLEELVRRMAEETSFVSAVLSEDPETPDSLVLFEVWNRSKEEWLDEQPHRPYRGEYDNATKDVIANKEVRFLSPLMMQRR